MSWKTLVSCSQKLYNFENNHHRCQNPEQRDRKGQPTHLEIVIRHEAIQGQNYGFPHHHGEKNLRIHGKTTSQQDFHRNHSKPRISIA